MKGHFVEREIAPQHYGGVDYSARGIVLVRTPTLMLVWRKGGSVWSGIGMPHSYTETHLQVIGVREAKTYDRILSDDIFRGGRLSVKRVKEKLPEIRKALKLSKLRMEHIDFKKTYIVEEP